MEYTLFKNRSYRGVISAGFGLYFTHFRLFFKASWLMALLYAAVFAALGTLCAVQLPAITATIMKQVVVHQAPLSIETARQYLMLTGSIIVLSLLYVVVEALTYATVLSKLKEHQDAGVMTVPPKWFSVCYRLMGRTLKGVFYSVIVLLVPVLVLAGLLVVLLRFIDLAPFTLMVTVMLVMLSLLLLSLPLVFIFIKYVLNKETPYFTLFPHGYSTGFRHWGHIFTVCLIGGMIIGVLLSIYGLPAIILTQANVVAQEGFLNGDSLGMPVYITLLTVVTFFLTGFVLVYICMPMILIAYYMYGSIESYEREKNKIEI